MKSRHVFAAVVTIILVLVSIPSAAFLQGVSADFHTNVTKTWFGGTGDWETAGNWSPSGVPDAGDDVYINAGSVTISSAQSVASLTFSGSTLSGSGTLTVTGTMAWTGGTMDGTGATTIASGGVMNVSGSNKALDQRTLNNYGTVNWGGAPNWLNTGPVINNHPGGTFNLQADMPFAGGGSSPIFNNLAGATLNKDSTVATATVSATFNNSGTVNVTSGTLNLYNGGAGGGSYNVSAGASLGLAGNPYSLDAGSSANGTGTLVMGGGTVNVAGGFIAAGTISITNATVNFNGDANSNNVALTGGTISGPGTLTVSGTLNWSGGTMDGTGATTIASGGVMNVSGSNKALSERTLNNYGTVNWAGAPNWLNTGPVINNQSGGIFNLQADMPFAGGGSLPTFNNLAGATFNKDSTVATATVSAAFNNSGTVNATSGTLSFAGAYAQTGTGSSIVLNGGSLSTATPLSIPEGALKGSGTITGDVSIGSSGSVDVELGGTTPGTGTGDYDQLNISGSVTLAGTLNVTLTSGFTPAIGDSFTIMTFASHTGTFATTNLAAPGAGRAWNAAAYNPAGVVLSVIAGTNHAPTAADDAYTTNEDTPFNQAAAGVLANDTDTDGNSLSAVLVSNVSHGTLVLNPDGSFTYTPAANYSATDSFTYKANDGTTDSAVATVTITVNAVNDAPLASTGGASYSTSRNTVLNQAAPGVLGNVTDADGNPLTAILVSNVSHGTLVLNADGSFTYTPANGFIGTDSFTCKANDGTADSSVFTVTIEVTQGEPTTITSLSRTSGRQGKRLTVVITGTNLGQATGLDFGAGITVGTPAATSPTEITVEITIDSDAALGARDVVVTTPEGTFALEGGFTVEKAKSGGVPVWLWPVVVVAVLAAGAAGFFLFFVLPRRKAKRA